MVEAVECAVATVRASGKAYGLLAMNQAIALRYAKLNCGFVAVGVEVVMLVRGAERLWQDFRRSTR